MVDGKEVSNFYGSSPLTDNSWHHVVLGMDDNETRIYVDGQSINPRGYAGGRSRESIFRGCQKLEYHGNR